MLDKKTIKFLKQTVHKHLQNDSYKAFIFGSRVTGNNRKYSDIDLGIIGNKPLSTKEYISITSDFEDSDLPYRVDLVDFNTVSDKFKAVSLNKIVYI